MGVVYNKNRNEYKVFIPTGITNKYKQFSYSVNRYGEELTKKLANKSFEDKTKYHDYYEEVDDKIKFYVYTKSYGIKNVYIDKEDLEKVLPYKLSISNDNNAKTFYCKVINGVGLHRIITDAKSGEIVDHINRNGLDNTKENLRIVNTSINNRNASLRSDNVSGTKGVSFEKGKRYKAEWYDLDGNKKSKSFSIAKYGEQEALRLATEYRLLIEKDLNYITAQQSSETIENTSIGVNTIEGSE